MPANTAPNALASCAGAMVYIAHPVGASLQGFEIWLWPKLELEA